MVIVDNRDFIKPSLEDHQLNMYDFHDAQQVLSVEAFSKLSLTRRMDVLLIDTQSVLNDQRLFENCKAVINTFQGCYFIHDESNRAARKWVAEQASFFPKIIGECALPMPELNWTLLANQLQFFWTLLQEQRSLQKHMAEFSLELDHVLETAQSEMNRAKKLHEMLVPKRSEEIKGVQFVQKYASGEAGAEFSDLLQTPTKAYQILVASESYLISSSLMGILNGYKARDFDPMAFMADARADISAINGSKKKKAQVDVLVLELDLNNLTLRSFGDHKAEFYSQLKGRQEIPVDGYKLSRGEKFIVFSPGFLFNWKESNKQDILAFLKAQPGLTQQELMTELFFHVRTDKEGQFLKRDATVVMMEVHRHGMHQV